MNKSIIKILTLACMCIAGTSCGMKESTKQNTCLRYQYPCILDISVTPEHGMKRVGCFTDAGSWMGFTIPQKDKWINGFCGPFSIDNRVWFAQSAVSVSIDGAEFLPDSISYFPGEVYMSAKSEYGSMEQRMVFASASTALVNIKNNSGEKFSVSGKGWNKDITLKKSNNIITASHPNGETVQITFPQDFDIICNDTNYTATNNSKNTYVAISFYASENELMSGEQKAVSLLNNPESAIKNTQNRWEGYLSKILRTDMKHEYNRVAVKSVVTLISNWRTHREGLLHDGVIPSHAVNYFIGFWAWDSWRFSAALARFEPELA